MNNKYLNIANAHQNYVLTINENYLSFGHKRPSKNSFLALISH